MPDTFSVYKFPDSNSGSCQKLLDSVKDSIVKMKKSMQNIMPNKMHVHFMSISSLSAMVTKVALKMIVAVFANSGHTFFITLINLTLPVYCR